MRRGRGTAFLKIRNCRAERIVLALVRRSFQILRFLPIALSARWAEQLFLTPPRQASTRRERETLSSGRFRRVRAGHYRIATWRWGKGPTVVLVHGWGGHAGRLSLFVAPLTQAGFSVVAFDAPGHSASEGKLCDLSDFVRALQAVVRHYRAAAVVGHSLGGAACLLAMRRGLRVDAAVLLAPLADPEEYTGRFATICRMPVPVRDSMKVRVAARQRVSWERLRLARSAPSRAAPVLIFHDTGDLTVPVKNGRAIAAVWPGSDLVTTRGLGHHKILRDEQIIRSSTSFLARTLLPARGRGGLAAAGGMRLSAGDGKTIAQSLLRSVS